MGNPVQQLVFGTRAGCAARFLAATEQAVCLLPLHCCRAAQASVRGVGMPFAFLPFFHHTRGSLYVMEACAAEAAVVVLLLLCQTTERTGIFENCHFQFLVLPSSVFFLSLFLPSFLPSFFYVFFACRFLVASLLNTQGYTGFFPLGFSFLSYKTILPHSHLVQVHRHTVHVERNEATLGKRVTGLVCIPSPTATTTTTTTTTCVCACVCGCVRACVRAGVCVRACVRARVYAFCVCGQVVAPKRAMH